MIVYREISVEEFLDEINREASCGEREISGISIKEDVSLSEPLKCSVTFKDCEFRELKIHNICADQKEERVLKFINVTADKLNFFDLKNFTIEIQGGTYNQLNFFHSHLKVYLKEVESIFAGVGTNEKTSSGAVEIEDCSFQDLESHRFGGSLTIAGTKVRYPVEISGTGHNSLRLTLQEGNELNVTLFYKFGVLELVDSVVDEGRWLNFKKATIGTLSIENFANKGEVRFLGFTSSGDLYIVNSDLGNTMFMGSNLLGFQTIRIQDSILTKVRSTGTLWPDNINQDNIIQKREVYRQLKYAMISQHDRISELQFHNLEINAHYEYLSWRKHRWDKLSLSISKYTNDYGNSYILPICIYLLVGFILYALMLLASHKLDTEYVGDYFVFLNPTHKPDFIEGLSAVSKAIDFLGKVCFAFLIFQIVSAFRKLYKK